MTRSGFRFAAFHQCGRFFSSRSVHLFIHSIDHRCSAAVASIRDFPKEKPPRVLPGNSRVKELLGGGRQRLVTSNSSRLKPDDRSRVGEREGRPVRIGRYAEFSSTV